MRRVEMIATSALAKGVGETPFRILKINNVEQFERMSQRRSDDPSSRPSIALQPAGSSRA
jgi:hypothetical protein